MPVTRDNKAEMKPASGALLKKPRWISSCLWRAIYPSVVAVIVERYPSRVINIHHSFLPAFDGASPITAPLPGVKLIGATSHHVTEVDDGPIIEREVARISHRDDVKTPVQKAATWKSRVVARRALGISKTASWPTPTKPSSSTGPPPSAAHAADARLRLSHAPD